jgi:hypothetical protein
MKKCCLILLTVLVSFLSFPAFAQNNSMPVKFRTGDFITGNNIQQRSFQQNELQSSFFNDGYYVLVQFAVLPSALTKQVLKSAGLELGNYIPGNAYLAFIKKGFDFSLADKFSIVSINNFPSSYKIDADL